jgi:hypothetical protein
MDLEITFDDKTMCTPVYIKMDAADQLLLSEGVCRQLGVVTFHPKVEQWRGHSKKTVKKSTPTPGAQAPETSTPESSAPERHSSLSLPAASEPNLSEATHPPTTTEAKVPAVRVNLVQFAHFLLHQSQIVEVSIDCQEDIKLPLLLDGETRECSQVKEPNLSTSSEEFRPSRSQRRTGLRAKTTQPTRLMTTRLEDEPP